MNNSPCTDSEYCREYFLQRYRLKAARRALAICNKLKPSETKARHAARILRALNKLRAAV